MKPYCQKNFFIKGREIKHEALLSKEFFYQRERELKKRIYIPFSKGGSSKHLFQRGVDVIAYEYV
jgi:hypothetical protein